MTSSVVHRFCFQCQWLFIYFTFIFNKLWTSQLHVYTFIMPKTNSNVWVMNWARATTPTLFSVFPAPTVDNPSHSINSKHAHLTTARRNRLAYNIRQKRQNTKNHKNILVWMLSITCCLRMSISCWSCLITFCSKRGSGFPTYGRGSG